MIVDAGGSGDPSDPSPTELRPTRVRDGSWRVIVAVTGLFGVGFVSLAVLAKVVAPVPILPTDSPAPAAFAPAPDVSPRARAIPGSLDCHGLGQHNCEDIVAAALAVLPGDLPDVATAAAWGSLLCDSTMECSPSDLRLATPRGSVVLSFADGGTEAWLNVVDRPIAGGAELSTQAWIVAWVPPPAPRPSPTAARSS